MCKSDLHPFLAALPKCEHHIHIEGSLSPELLFRLAKANNISLPSTDTDASFASASALNDRYTRFTDLNDFLHYYFIGMSCLINVADFESLAYEYFQKAHADGVHHSEIFFDPQAHTSRGVAYETVVAGFVAAQKRALKDFGLTSKLILCFLRHLPASEADATFAEADAAGHFADGTVSGIGLDSSEVGFPPELFKEVYSTAQKKGINRTAHAGEEGDPSYIRGALDTNQVQRIDHGIRLAEDPELLARVVKENIMLSVCPLSNVRLRCVKNVAEMPIRKFLDAGVKFSINSDDPAYFGGYILDNYCAVQEAFHLTKAEWRGIAEAAIQGSWCDAERKREMMSSVETCMQKFATAA